MCQCHNQVWPSRFYCECYGDPRMRTSASATSAHSCSGWASRSGSRAAITSSLTREDVDEILNLQPRKSLAKGYQVKQVRKVLVQYKLAKEADRKSVVQRQRGDL